MDNTQKKNFKDEIINTLGNEIIDARRQFFIRPTELIVTIVSLAIGVLLLCLNLISLLGLSLILFGAMWNFFTSSNKFFACIMAFFMCVAYGFIAGNIKVYGHAFLHLMFYLPTQLIYYYENDKKDNTILHDKSLSQAGYIGTVVCGWLIAFALGIILYKVGDPYYIMDALSTTLLIVSVFLVNGRYREYFPVRLVAVLFASMTWTYIGIKTGFAENVSAFILLFIMYLFMDTIKFIRWKNYR